jgi:glutamine synthetase
MDRIRDIVNFLLNTRIKWRKVCYLKLIERILQDLELTHNLYPKIGAEIEFYLVGEEVTSEKTSDITVIAEQNSFLIKEERGNGQYECAFDYSANMNKVIQDIKSFKSLIKSLANKSNLVAEFRAKPIKGDYGSALQLNLSLHDDDSNNLLSSDTMILEHAVSGILEICRESLFLLCESEDDFDRFISGFMAPTKVCWGGNNRTTAVRIPDSKPKNKRIEFRLPPADCDPAIAIFVMLYGVLHGLNAKSKPCERIYGNAFDDIYNSESLPKTLQEAKFHYENKGKIAKYVMKYI